jgi:hypothetical protein
MLGVVAGHVRQKVYGHFSGDFILDGRRFDVVVGFVHPCFGHLAVSYIEMAREGRRVLF